MRTRLAVVLAAILALGACTSADSGVVDAYAAEAEARASAASAPSTTQDDPTPTNPMPTDPAPTDPTTTEDDASIGDLAGALRGPVGMYAGISIAEARCAARAIVETIDPDRAVAIVEDAQYGEGGASAFEANDIADAILACTDFRQIFSDVMTLVYRADPDQRRCIDEAASDWAIHGALQLDFLPFAELYEVAEPLDEVYQAVGECLGATQIREYLTRSTVAMGNSVSEATCYSEALTDSMGDAEAFRVYSTLLVLSRPNAEHYVAAAEQCLPLRENFFQGWSEPGDPDGLEDCVSDDLTDAEIPRIYVGLLSEVRDDDPDQELLRRYFDLLDRCYAEAGQGT